MKAHEQGQVEARERTLEDVARLFQRLLIRGQLGEDKVPNALSLLWPLPQHMLQQQAVVQTDGTPAAGVRSHLPTAPPQSTPGQAHWHWN